LEQVIDEKKLREPSGPGGRENDKSQKIIFGLSKSADEVINRLCIYCPPADISVLKIRRLEVCSINLLNSPGETQLCRKRDHIFLQSITALKRSQGRCGSQIDPVLNIPSRQVSNFVNSDQRHAHSQSVNRGMAKCSLMVFCPRAELRGALVSMACLMLNSGILGYDPDNECMSDED